MAKWLRRQPGSPKHRDEPSQAPLMHSSNKRFLKLSNATRGHQCFVWNWKVYHINSPTRKSKWWTTVFVQNKRPKNLITQTKWHLMKSNCKPALMHWSQICVHQEVFTPSKQRTHFPCDLFAKNYITSGIMKLYSCMIHKHKVKLIFTCIFPAPLSVPYHIQMITTNATDLMNFTKHFFSPFYSTVLMTAMESHWNFFTCYVERCLSKDHETNTDTLTTLMLTKCVNTLTGNLPDFH